MECRFVSETFVLYDTLFYDSGVTGTTNTNWYVYGGTGTKTVDETGTTLSNSNDTRYDIFTKTGANTIYFWNAPFCVELDIISISGGARLQIYSVGNDTLNACGSVGHWKIIYDGTTVSIYDPSDKIWTYERSMPNARIGFIVPKDTSVKFKDLKIYPI